MNIRLYRYLLVLNDAAIAVVSLFLAIALRYDAALSPDIARRFFAYSLLFCGIALLVSFLRGSYYSVWAYAGFCELLKQFLSVAVMGLALLLLQAFGIILLPASVILIFSMLYFLLALPARFWHRFELWLIARIRLKTPIPRKNVLVIGGGYAGTTVIEKMASRPGEGLFPVAVIDDDPGKLDQSIDGVKVVGGRSAIPEAVKKYDIQQIVIAIPSIGETGLRDLYDICAECAVPVKIVPHMMDFKDYCDKGKSIFKDIRLEDLLFRDEIRLGGTEVDRFLSGKTVLVTGGAGSIGSEICRQVLSGGCAHLIVFDICENGLYEIGNELKARFDTRRFTIVLGSVRDKNKLRKVFQTYHPQIVLHAAAHKHVPLMQENPLEAIKNNIAGTYNVIQASLAGRAEKFILISTDKAVNPTSVMGATKRFAELIMQAYNCEQTPMAAVRFGNVLGSAGSVIPLFKKQIEQGGPVTITHPDMRRFFMTIPEAVCLVLQTGALTESGGVYVLDMGQPVKIYDLACDLIKLSGLRPNVDIKIAITGLRPGEKLYEELHLPSESFSRTKQPKISICRGAKPSIQNIQNDLAILMRAIEREDCETVADLLFEMVGRYSAGKQGESAQRDVAVYTRGYAPSLASVASGQVDFVRR